MFNRLCINDLFALQRYKNFWTFLLFPLAFRALGTNCLQVGNFSLLSFDNRLRNAIDAIATNRIYLSYIVEVAMDYLPRWNNG